MFTAVHDHHRGVLRRSVDDGRLIGGQRRAPQRRRDRGRHDPPGRDAGPHRARRRAGHHHRQPRRSRPCGRRGRADDRGGAASTTRSSRNASGPYAGVADETFAEAGSASVQPAGRDLPRRARRRDHPAARRRSPPTPDIGYTGLRAEAATACSPPRRIASRTRTRRAAAALPRHRRRRPVALALLSPGSRAAPSPGRFARSSGRPRRWPTAAFPAAVRQILDTPAGEDVGDPRGRADHGEDPGRGQPGRRRAVEGAVERRRPRRRAGRAPPQHLRLVHQPRPPQPEPPQPPARLHHRARAQRDRPRQPRGAVPPRPPRHPHAAQRRVAPGARRHRAAAPVVRAGRGGRRRPRGARRGGGLPASRRAQPRAGRRHRVRWPPTSPTCSPS